MRLPPARATITICAITGLAFCAALTLGQIDRVAELAGFIPARVSGMLDVPGAAPVWITPLSATLVHGGVWHIVFNLLMIGFCGRLVEASIGSVSLVLLYVVGAYAAAMAQYAVMPHSADVMIGASGAGSAVIGAYALLYSRKQLKGWGPISGQWLQVMWLAAAWIGLQALIDFASVGVPGVPAGGAIATPAHVGGFLAGIILARPLLLFRYRKA
jgi:membrane associated rhomboid family serine protease